MKIEIKIDRNEMVRELAELYIKKRLTLCEYLDRVELLFTYIINRKYKERDTKGE